MTKHHLPYDYARCAGNGRNECNTCLRKLAPGHPYRQVYMGAWDLDTPCESRIPVEKKDE